MGERTMPTGKVKWFNEKKGFGFIEVDGDGTDAFAHFSDILGEGFLTLKKGQKVEFEFQQGEKGPKAVDIRVPSLEGNEIPKTLESAPG